MIGIMKEFVCAGGCAAAQVQGDDQLASIFDFVQEALDFPREIPGLNWRDVALLCCLAVLSPIAKNWRDVC